MCVYIFAGNLQLSTAETRTCTMLQIPDQDTLTPWSKRIIKDSNVITFRALIGPTGGDQGFTGTTSKSVNLLDRRNKLTL